MFLVIPKISNIFFVKAEIKPFNNVRISNEYDTSEIRNANI